MERYTQGLSIYKDHRWSYQRSSYSKTSGSMKHTWLAEEWKFVLGQASWHTPFPNVARILWLSPPHTALHSNSVQHLRSCSYDTACAETNAEMRRTRMQRFLADELQVRKTQRRWVTPVPSFRQRTLCTINVP